MRRPGALLQVARLHRHIDALDDVPQTAARRPPAADAVPAHRAQQPANVPVLAQRRNCRGVGAVLAAVQRQHRLRPPRHRAERVQAAAGGGRVRDARRQRAQEVGRHLLEQRLGGGRGDADQPDVHLDRRPDGHVVVGPREVARVGDGVEAADAEDAGDDDAGKGSARGFLRGREGGQGVQPSERDDEEEDHLLPLRQLERQDVGHHLHREPRVGDHVADCRGDEVRVHVDAAGLHPRVPERGHRDALERRDQYEGDGIEDDVNKRDLRQDPVERIGKDVQVEEADGDLGQGERQVVEEKRGVVDLGVDLDGRARQFLDVDSCAIVGLDAGQGRENERECLRAVSGQLRRGQEDIHPCNT